MFFYHKHLAHSGTAQRHPKIFIVVEGLNTNSLTKVLLLSVASLKSAEDFHSN